MSDGFDIDYKLLPPKLRMQIWVLALDADTKKVNLAYKNGAFRSNLAYKYGGNVQAAMRIRRVTTSLSVNPKNGDVDLGVAFKGFKFGASASYTSQSGSLSLGYGAKLLPFPESLASTFNSASDGLGSMAHNIEAAPDNPLAWYKMHSDDLATIKKAIAVGQKIQGSDQKFFGAGLRLNYHPETGLTIYGGAQFRF